LYIIIHYTINLKILTIKCENINKMSSYRISTRNVFGQSGLNYRNIEINYRNFIIISYYLNVNCISRLVYPMTGTQTSVI